MIRASSNSVTPAASAFDANVERTAKALKLTVVSILRTRRARLWQRRLPKHVVEEEPR
jgi:hypothetical protein